MAIDTIKFQGPQGEFVAKLFSKSIVVRAPFAKNGGTAYARCKITAQRTIDDVLLALLADDHLAAWESIFPAIYSCKDIRAAQ